MFARILRKLFQVTGLWALLLRDAEKRAIQIMRKRFQTEEMTGDETRDRIESIEEGVTYTRKQITKLAKRLRTVERAEGRMARTAENLIMGQMEALSGITDEHVRGDLDRMLRERLIARLRRKDEAQCEARIQQQSWWPVLQGYLERSESTGCSYADYWTLYELIRAHRPREVLECGTGSSTVVMALALRENAADGAPGRLTSMEGVARWFDAAQKLLPAEVEDLVDLRFSEPTGYTFSMFRGRGYSELPERDYELAFIDGPSTHEADGSVTFDFDYINAVRVSSKPVLGVVDTRLATCFVLQQIVGKSNFRFDEVRDLGFVGPCTEADLKAIRRSTSEAFRHSIRLYGQTVLSMDVEREEPS